MTKSNVKMFLNLCESCVKKQNIEEKKYRDKSYDFF